MLTIIIAILGLAFLLYTLLGGADFGAGIVESFAGKKEEPTIAKAIAPVWEANHVWLILAVVILFTGFPLVYSSLSLVLHIPLMMVLIGIICRGTAFTFRNYDITSEEAHPYFTALFRISSFITPLFLGIVLGAMILGRIRLDPGGSFYETFVWPWLNFFCLFLGLFSVSLFAYISSIFLVGESTNDAERRMYVRFSRVSMLTTMLAGLMVFVFAEMEGLELQKEFLHSPASVMMLIAASLACPFIWHFLKKKNNKTLYLRLGVGIQVSAIMVGWFYTQYPVMINLRNGQHLTFFNTQAPESTLKQLLIALVTGLVLVVPAFVYLFKIFKIKKPDGKTD